jgi:nuclear GTP-binding protein
VPPFFHFSQDPGLPSQWPFKEELVKEFAFKRAQILADEKRKKDEKKARRMVSAVSCVLYL